MTLTDLKSDISLNNSISIVIPVYNSEQCLPVLVERINSVLSAFCQQFEVILVNDGSKDQSWRVISDLVASYEWVAGINLMRNYGQHNALLCGIQTAQYEVIVTIDDDLQHPPQEIPKLLHKLSEGYDVVYGTPQKEQHGLWRYFAARITRIVLKNAMGVVDNASNVSAFRAFRAQVCNAFADYRSPFVSIDVLLAWGTTKFCAIAVRHEQRYQGISNYTLRTLLIHASNMLTGFSTLPLQLASFIGFGFTVFGFFVLAYGIGRYFIQGASIPGFPFLASIIAIFSGAQLFSLGIIGEYLARMHFRTMGKPPSVIREKIGFKFDRKSKYDIPT